MDSEIFETRQSELEEGEDNDQFQIDRYLFVKTFCRGRIVELFIVINRTKETINEIHVSLSDDTRNPIKIEKIIIDTQYIWGPALNQAVITTIPDLNGNYKRITYTSYGTSEQISYNKHGKEIDLLIMDI